MLARSCAVVARSQLSKTLLRNTSPIRLTTSNLFRRCYSATPPTKLEQESEDELVIELSEKIKQSLAEYKKNCWKPITHNLPVQRSENLDQNYLNAHRQVYLSHCTKFGGYPSLLKGETWPHYNIKLRTDAISAATLGSGSIGERRFSAKQEQQRQQQQQQQQFFKHSIPLHFMFQINLNDVPQEAKENYSPLFPFVDDFLNDTAENTPPQQQQQQQQQQQKQKHSATASENSSVSNKLKEAISMKASWEQGEQKRQEDIKRKSKADAGLLQVFACLSDVTSGVLGIPYNNAVLLRIIPTREIDPALSDTAFTSFPVKYSVDSFPGFATFDEVVKAIPSHSEVAGYQVLPCKKVMQWSKLESYPGLFEERHIDAKILTLLLQHEDATDEMKQLRRSVPEHVKELAANYYLKTYNQLGEVLGGWPQWVKAVDYPNCKVNGCQNFLANVVFHLGGVLRSTAEEEEEVEASGLLPIVWGEGVPARVLQCPTHRTSLSFSWEDAELPSGATVQQTSALPSAEERQLLQQSPLYDPSASAEATKPKKAANKTKTKTVAKRTSKK